MSSRLTYSSLLVGCLTLLSACVGRGEITWQGRTAELRADPGVAPATVLEARYSFANTGKSTVEITSLESDCGCTVPKLEKRSYVPSEKGEVLARFTIGDSAGRIEKHVLLTVSGEQEPTKLTLVIIVPELLRIEPTKIGWTRNEENTPKKMLITAGTDVIVKKLTVRSSQQLFAPELKVLEDGRRYELTVTPACTNLPLVGLLLFSGEFDAPMAGLEVKADHDLQRSTVHKVVSVNATVK